MTNEEVLGEALYKYRSFGGDYGQSNVERIIKDSEMFWQSPLSFNDPFDCHPYFVFGATARERKDYAETLVRKFAAGKGRNARRQDRSHILAMGQAGIRRSGQSVLARSAIMCFTTKPDNMLMWSHYAENHTGVCFRFKQMGDPTPFVGLPVTYSDERPEADVTKMETPGHDFLKASVLTKASCWCYEDEKRMIADRGGPGFRKFPPHALTGVIFGAKIATKHRGPVMNLLAIHRPGIEILQAEMDARHYRLNLVTA